MKPLKASVVIPAYNSAGTITQCLNALKDQSAKSLEVIVVDDGSHDNTLQLAKSLGAGILAQKHAGPASARNRGARTAVGDIILFTDADCIPDRDWVKEMLAPFDITNIAGVQGAYGTNQDSLMARFTQFEIELRYRRLAKAGHIDFIGTYSAAYRRQIFLKSGGFDESFPEASGEDPELSFRLSKSGHKMIFNPRALVFHKHPDTLGKYLKQKFNRARWRVLLYRKHPGKAVSESYTPQALKLQIALFYLFALFLILSPFHSMMPYFSLTFLVLLFLSTVPFSIIAGRRDKSLGLASPLIIVLRSASFSLGLLRGLF